MPSIAGLERAIWNLEGFRVRITHRSGRDVRSDQHENVRYSWTRRAKSTMSVAQWIEKRFSSRISGYDVVVLLNDGTTAHGRTLLETVRATYDDHPRPTVGRGTPLPSEFTNDPARLLALARKAVLVVKSGGKTGLHDLRIAIMNAGKP